MVWVMSQQGYKVTQHNGRASGNGFPPRSRSSLSFQSKLRVSMQTHKGEQEKPTVPFLIYEHTVYVFISVLRWLQTLAKNNCGGIQVLSYWITYWMAPVKILHSITVSSQMERPKFK